MQYDVVGIGTIVVDHQIVLPSYPLADTKTEVILDRFQIGGPVPTALVLLSRFGKRCLFIGKWGKDRLGELIEQDLRNENVAVEKGIQVDGDSTGFAHVWVDQSTGSRTIAFSRGGFTPLVASDVSLSCLSHCKLLHLDGWSGDAVLAAIKIVKDGGGRIFLDAGSPKPGMEDLIRHVDVINCPEVLVKKFPALACSANEAEAAKKLLAMGASAAVFTKGEHGASLYQPDKPVVRAGFGVSAVDCTGAGDVFCGAFIYGLIEKWPAAEALKFAAAAAALKCTRMGNRDALPDKIAVHRMISSNTSMP